MPKQIAKEVLKDLYRKDSIQSELSALQKNYALLEVSSNLKDTLISNKSSIITMQKEREGYLDSIVSVKNSQIKEYSDLSEKLKFELVKSKKANAFHWGATLVSFLLAIGAVVF
jgi:hypothetical protein